MATPKNLTVKDRDHLRILVESNGRVSYHDDRLSTNTMARLRKMGLVLISRASHRPDGGILMRPEFNLTDLGRKAYVEGWTMIHEES